MDTELHIKILLVGDSQVNNELILAMLEEGEEHFEIECAKLLSDASEILLNSSFDIVLLEVPDKSGQEVFDMIKARVGDTPVMLISFPSDGGLMIKTIHKGTRDYLANGALDSNVLLHSIIYAVERKKIVSSLRSSEEEWKRIFCLIDNPMAIIGKNLSVLFVNLAFARALGKTTEDILGHKCYEVISKNNARHSLCPIKELSETGHYTKTEMELKFGSGTYSFTCTPILDESGNVDKIVHVATDITMRKEAEEKLLESRRTFELLAKFNAITSNIEKKNVIYSAVEFIQTQLHAERTSIALLQSKLDSFHVVEVLGKEAKITKDFYLPTNGTELYEVFNYFQARYRPDTASQLSMCETGMESIENGVRSDFIVPLKVGQKSIGTLKVSSSEINGFSGYERNLLALLAPHLAKCFQNMELFGKLKEERNFISTILDTTNALVVVLDKLGRIARFNRAAEKTSGYTQREVQGKCIWEKLLPLEEIEACERFIKSVAQSKSTIEHDKSWVAKDGSLKNIRWSSTPLLDADGNTEYVICTGIDVTKRKQAEERIKYMVNHDLLTGLPNRVFLNNILDKAVRNAKSFALMFLNLENFKHINSTLGHSAGNFLIYQAAERLKSCVRAEDKLVKLEGDEFAMVLNNIKDQGSVENFAHRILKRMDEAFEVDKHKLYLNFNIGCATYPQEGVDAGTLTENALTAMLYAKKSDKYALYNSKMLSADSKYIDLAYQIRDGLERKEFVLYYQAKMDLLSKKIVGMEALVRWNHPDMGFMSPGRFIPVAEKTDLIIPLGEYVLEMACRQNKEWQNAGYKELLVSVNMAAKQLYRKDLLQTVKTVLRKTKLDPSTLEFEVTETDLIKNAALAVDTLTKLREMGIKISLDDFGTGYSSLRYLKSLPVDTVKIDISFIANLPHDKNDAEITTAIVAMAHSLNIRTIAEGVENKEQLDFLSNLRGGDKCDEVQGFLFSRPLPAEEFVKLIPLENS